MEAGAPPTRRRRRISVGLAVLGALFLLVGGILLYASRAIFDSEQFADRALTALEEERVHHPLADELANAILEKAPRQVADARPLVVSVTTGVIDSPEFRRAFHDAVEHAHRTLFTRKRDKLVLKLADGASVALEEVRINSPKVGGKLEADPRAKLDELLESGTALQLVRIAEDVRLLGVLLPIFGALLLVLAIGLDRDRRRGTFTVAIAVSVAAAVGLVAYLIGRGIALGQLEGELRGAAEGLFDAFLADLGTGLLIALLAALAAAAVIAAGRPEGRLPRLGRELASPSGWRGHGLRAALLIAAGLLLIGAPDVLLRSIAVVAGAYVAIFGAAELVEAYNRRKLNP